MADDDREHRPLLDKQPEAHDRDPKRDEVHDGPGDEQAADAEKQAPAALKDDQEPPPEPQLVDMQRRTDHYYTTFYGPVHAGAFGIGGSAPDSQDLRSASIDDADVQATLKSFATPPAYDVAATILHRHHIVVLSGSTKTGRRCGALALLAQSAPAGADIRRPIVELTPGGTTAQLLSYSFESGGRYVLTDYSPGDVTSEQIRFDLGQLHRRLADASSFVVATSNAPPATFHHFAVAWNAVDCRDVLDAYLQGRDHSYDGATMSDLRGIAAHRSPGEMPEFFKLLERSGPEAVEQHFQDGTHNDLRELISGKPCVPTLLPLVAAAFLPGTIERNYEAHLDRLRELVDEHARRDPSTQDYTETLEQSRQRRAEWVTSRSHPFTPGERIVELSGTGTRELLLAELRQHYGRELWKPVHEWLLERPKKITGLGDEQALATGTATLAQVDPSGANSVLDAWAQDDSLAGLWAAAATVSALCMHETTVADALRHAVRWAGGTRRRKLTAALSFGQTLGRVFPVQAMSYLWYLALREQPVSRPARNQFAVLVRAASRDDDRIRRALSIVDWQLEQVLLDQAHDERLIGKALETVSAVLSVDLPNEESLTQHVLRRLPDQIRRVGSLWAEVMRSWEHRDSALSHLRATHDALDSEGAVQFAALGETVQQRLAPVEWQWVCRDLALEAWKPTRHPEVAA